MQLVKTFLTALVAFCIAIPALAVVTAPIHDLPSHGTVVLAGEVKTITSARSFTLRDPSGVIDVQLPSHASLVLKEGDHVTVTGKIRKGLFGKSIHAKHVVVYNSHLAGPLPSDVQRAEIGTLPKSGWVKLSGTVEKVSSDKQFILGDSTGQVPVSLDTDEQVTLAKGARVTVIGKVDNGLLGVLKDIQATHVTVVADAQRL